MFGVIPFLPPGVDPTQCLPLIINGQGSVAAAAGSETEICNTALLSAYQAVILCMGVTVRSVPEYEYTGNLIFSLSVGGSPFPDNNQGTWTAQRGSIVQPVPVFINCRLNSRITFNVRRAAVAAALSQTVAFFASGIMYPLGKEKPVDAAQYRV